MSGVPIPKGTRGDGDRVVGLFSRNKKAELSINFGSAFLLRRELSGPVGPENTAGGPVLFLQFGDDDIHGLGRAADGSAASFGDGFDEFAFLFEGAAFENLDIESGHERLLLKA